MYLFKSALVVFKSILFLIAVPGTVLLYVPFWLVDSPFNTRFSPDAIRFAALVPWGAGSIILFRCLWDFIFRGKGTPAPVDPPKELVIEGLYHFVRNPMYLGIMLILSGHILWFRSVLLILYAVCVFAVFHLFIVFYEEPELEKRFGDSYKLYSHRVSRWIPRFFRE